MNTVDGGCAFVYCYDKNNKYLGMATGEGNGYIYNKTVREGTAKIKISLKGEKRLDAVVALTKRTLYYTYEFGACITVTDSKNITINGVTANDPIGDCVIKTENLLFSGLCATVSFKNSELIVPRKNILQYGTTNFIDSKITFLQDGTDKDFTWNTGGYGYERCPWNFTNCTFTSSLPVTIGGNVVNSIIEGNVKVPQVNN